MMLIRFFVWAVVVGTCAAAVGWHVYENHSLKHRLHLMFDNLEEPVLTWVGKFALSRTIQLIASVAIIMALLYTLDGMYFQIKLLEYKLSQATPQQAAAAAPVTAAPVAQPQAAAAQPVAAAPVAAAPAAAQPQAATSQVEQVYNPEKSSSDAGAAMDEIKKRYEGILVTHMFLKRCGKTGGDDYGVIDRAMTQEMTNKTSGVDQFKTNILTAAEGSYKEMYTQTPCEGANIDALQSQYTNYLKLLATNFPAR